MRDGAYPLLKVLRGAHFDGDGGGDGGGGGDGTATDSSAVDTGGGPAQTGNANTADPGPGGIGDAMGAVSILDFTGAPTDLGLTSSPPSPDLFDASVFQGNAPNNAFTGQATSGLAFGPGSLGPDIGTIGGGVPGGVPSAGPGSFTGGGSTPGSVSGESAVGVGTTGVGGFQGGSPGGSADFFPTFANAFSAFAPGPTFDAFSPAMGGLFTPIQQRQMSMLQDFGPLGGALAPLTGNPEGLLSFLMSAPPTGR
ncbi:MAG: hypothetical protein J2P16_00575 [Mycobacterium sp.]|nr:hypothetical protein [Mycobacterium sp.]